MELSLLLALLALLCATLPINTSLGASMDMPFTPRGALFMPCTFMYAPDTPCEYGRSRHSMFCVFHAKNCSVEDCRMKVNRDSYCTMHYRLYERYGDPDPTYDFRDAYDSGQIQCSCSWCSRIACRRGFCKKHNTEFLKTGEMPLPPQPKIRTCSVEGCDRPREAKGLCSTHYQRVRSAGTAGPAEIVNHKASLRECAVPHCSTMFGVEGSLCRTHKATAKRYSLSEDRLLVYYTSTCSACGGTDNLHIDHDHSCCAGPTSCGKCVRGVLCTRCNTALGLMRDNAEALRSAADYLDNHRRR